jgi:hypothetical protein
VSKYIKHQEREEEKKRKNEIRALNQVEKWRRKQDEREKEGKRNCSKSAKFKTGKPD